MRKMRGLFAAAMFALSATGALAAVSSDSEVGATADVKIENFTSYNDIAPVVNKLMSAPLKEQLASRGLALYVESMKFALDSKLYCYVAVGPTHPANGKRSARMPARYKEVLLSYGDESERINCHFNGLRQALAYIDEHSAAMLEEIELTQYESPRRAKRDALRKKDVINARNNGISEGDYQALIDTLLRAGFSDVVDHRDVSLTFSGRSFDIDGDSLCLASFSMAPSSPDGRTTRVNMGRMYNLSKPKAGGECAMGGAVYGAVKAYLNSAPSADDLQKQFGPADDGRMPASLAAISKGLPEVAAKF